MYGRIGHNYIPSLEAQEKPTTIDVNVVTVAPIVVMNATGILIIIFLLVIELCAHGNVFKYLPSECARQRPKNLH
jgi:hypothetical protein